MNVFEKAVRRVDRAQQGFRPAAFLFGVVKKFGDDRAGSLAALIAYYGFLSFFPLLLLLVSILGIVAGNSRSFAASVEHSALAQFPVIGNQLNDNIRALHRSSTAGLIVGLLGLVWGSQGAFQAGQYAMAEVWNVPGVVRPNFWARLVRTLLMMAVLGAFLLASTALAGIVSFATKNSGTAHLLGIFVTLLLNVALYVVAFRLLTPKQVETKLLVPGAILGGVLWTALQYLGAYLIDHNLRHTSQVYGLFAVVLGLMAWMYLGAQMTLYVAELNVVRANRFWPRSMVQPPLTEADERVLIAIGRQGQRRPEQHLSVRFHRQAMHETGEPPLATSAVARPDPAAAAAPGDTGLRLDPESTPAGDERPAI